MIRAYEVLRDWELRMRTESYLPPDWPGASDDVRRLIEVLCEHINREPNDVLAQLRRDET